jgi:hypothetical protein
MTPHEKMKMRAFRCGPVWEAAQAKADSRGETLADVIRRALERYVARKDKT